MNSIFIRSAIVALSFVFSNTLFAVPPQISYVSGAGPHPSGTTSVTIEISTDVLSNCRLNSVDDGNPSQWSELLTTSNNLNHTSDVPLSNDTDTTRYIYCRNVSTGEVSPTSYTFNITFASSNNTAPIISTTGPTEVFEDALYSYDVNASDAEDGTALDYSLVSPPSGMSINENTGLIQWTPDNNDVGNHAVNIVVTDSGGLTDSENFTLNVVNVNDAPTITSTDVIIANEGSAYSYDVDATDPDANDSLTFSLPVKPNGMTINSASGLISWVPTGAQVGSQTVEVLVTDNEGATDQRIFNITVDEANTAPEITSTAVLAATESVTYVYDVNAVDGNNSDTLTFSLDVSPTLMTINSESGVINWLPDNADVGQHNVTVVVSDQSGLSDSQSYVITVSNVNGAPVFTSVADLTAVENELYSYDAEATDDDSGDVITFSLVSPPSGMSIEPFTGLVEWTPNSSDIGDHDVTIEARDIDGLATQQNYVLNVSAVVADVGPVRTYISGAGPLSAGTTSTTMAMSTDVVATCRYNNVDDNNPAGWTTGFSSSDGTTHTANITIVDGEDTTRYIICKDSSSSVTNQVAYAFNITFETSNNQAPVVDSAAITSATVDVAYTYDVDASDPDAGDTLTYALLTNPASMSIDPNSGLITWTPTSSDIGDHDVVVEVSDQGALSVTQPYTITVSDGNQAPTISTIANLTIDEDNATNSLNFTVSDNETAANSLTVTSSSDNTSLVPSANVVLSGTDANRTVVVTPSSNENGSATITLTVSDGELSATETFTVTVNAVNDMPTITSIGDQTISEDSATSSLSFTVDDVETAASSLTVTSSSSNTVLVPNSNIVLSGSGSSRTVIVTPASNQGGNATITLTVSDGESSVDSSFELTVTSTNDVPTITAVSDQTINEDSATSSLSFTIGDTETAASSLTVTSSSSNTTLVPSANVVLSGTGANRSVVVTPAADESGSTTITLTVSDGALSVDETFVVTVSAVNDAPTITAIANQTIGEDTSTSSLSFTVDDEETSATSLSVTLSSSNTTLVPTANIVLSGTGASRTVVVTPVANENGDATITLTVSDGELTSSETFVVTVTAENDAPTITALSNQTIDEDSATNSLSFTVDDEETSASSLTVTSSSSDTTLVPNSNVVLSGSGSNRNVTVTPAANENGSAAITITVSDGDLTSTALFVVTVSAVNDSPTITAVSSQTVDEDNATSSLSFTIGDEETTADSLTVTSSSSNTTLVPSANIDLSGTGTNRNVVVTPAANESGTATITITVSDGSLSTAETFVVTVNSVNDLPTITSISDQSINQNESTGSLSFTISDVETSTSSLTVIGGSSNITLVPTNSITITGNGANRTVEVTPATNQNGSATITLTTTDGSGASQDTSFEITVNAPPTVDAGDNQTVNVDELVTLTAVASDIDGVISEYSWIQEQDDAPTVSLSDDDMDIITFTAPNVSRDTVFSFNVTVTDDNGQTATDSIEVTVIGIVPDWAKSEIDKVIIDDPNPVSPIILDHEIVGALEGQASVSGGAANYRIPIALPPGRAGMQPSVSLNYSSRSGNGIAGLGWSLGVGSSIHRCGQIAAVDGEMNLAVTYDADQDRLCLDGKRLMVVTGQYGVDGAVYRTELDTFVKVVQTGGINSATSSFTAYHKNGRTTYYGDTSGSRHSADGRTEIMSWAIAREQDQSDNSIIYEYANYGLGEHLLESIYYTGIDTTQGDRRVDFNYQTGTRSDRSFSFLAGGKTERTKLLESITTLYAGLPIRHYYLNYAVNESDTSERTILENVQECAFDSARIEQCLPATQFDTFTPSIAWDAELASDGTSGLYDDIEGFTSDDLIRMKDVNGDGIAEVLHLIRYEIPVTGQISTYAFNVDVYQLQNGSYNEVASSEDPVLSSQIHAGIEGDINGDGITDFINVDETDNTLVYYQFNKDFVLEYVDTGFVLTEDYERINIGQGIQLNDINGDGYQDIVFTRLGIDGTNYVAYYLNKANGDVDFHPPKTLFNLQIANFQSESASLMDMDGDGLLDVVLSFQRTELVSELRVAFTSIVNDSTLGYEFIEASQLGLPTNNNLNQFVWADLNGDGLKDFVRAVEVSTNVLDWQIRLNQGDRSFASETSLGTNVGTQKHFVKLTPIDGANKIQSTWGAMHVADLDGDGADELLVPTSSDDSLCITALGELLNTPSVNVEITSCNDDIHNFEHENTGNGASTYEEDWSQYDFRRFHWSILDFKASGSNSVSNSRVIEDVAYAPVTDLGFLDGSRIKSLSFSDYDNDGSLDFFYRTKDRFVATSIIPLENDYLNVSGFPRKATFNVSFDTVSPGDNFFSQRNIANDLTKNNDAVYKVEDGLGRVARWDYAPISRRDLVNGAELYSVPDDRENWYINDDPAREHFYFSSSMPVVTNFYESNGINGENETTYRYKEAIYNRKGRGFQGFRTIIVDNANDIRAITDFHQIFPKAGQIELATTCLTSSDEFCSTNKINQTDITYFDVTTANSDIYWVVPETSIATTYDVTSQNALSVKTTTINEADVDSLYGNILTSTQSIDTGSTFSQLLVTTVNTYDPASESDWWIDKLNTTKVTSQTTTGSALHDVNLDPTKEIETTYTWTANRQPEKVTIEPLQGGGKTTVVDTEYTTYGLPNSVSTYELNDVANARTVTTTYTKDGNGDGGAGSEEGYFVYQVTNDLGHTVTSLTYPEHGQVSSLTDANGLTSDTLYDAFGRIEQITPPVGTGQPAYSRFALCDAGCDAEITGIVPTELSSADVADIADLIRYKVTTTTAGAPETTLYKDKFNRVLVATTEGFDGNLILERTEYDHFGRKVFESIPYLYADRTSYQNIGTHWVAFDEQGRILEKRIDQPARLDVAQSFTTTYSYSDHLTTIDAIGTTKALPTMYRIYNGIGQLMQTTDALGGVTQYAYDAQGSPIVLQDANGNPITARYNALAQKEYVIDPNMGRKDFEYTAFGEIDSEADANGDTYYYDYDDLGRLTYRYLNIVPSDSNRDDSEASFSFDGTCNGAIDEEVREDLSGSNNFSKAYIYDGFCRPSSVTTTIDSVSYTQTTEYDGFYGRVKGGQSVSGITLETQYNDYGYATKSLNATSGYVYQEVTAMDARLNLITANKANGILSEVREYTPETGQMESVHTDTSVGGTQRHRIDYEYDDFGNIALQLVENIRSGSVIASSESYVYDDLHRLTTASQDIDGVNTSISYAYDAVGNITSKGDFGSGFAYGDINRGTDNAGPNAVVSVNKNSGGTATYEYDLNGNMTVGDGKTLTYNAFNKPLTISKDGITSTFSYGSDQMRYKQVKTGAPGGTETTIYVDKAYEEITQDGVTKKRSYLGDAIVTETIGGSDAGFKIGFVHRDRLGSVVTITDENGDMVDNKSFDPFGKPRQGTFEAVDSSTLTVLRDIEIAAGNDFEEHTRRGFTDHEHLDDSELIHMNGRVYDYNLGRFLSVDPFIQEPGNSQSMNPYSYIMNNPLAGTDPSGYTSQCQASDYACQFDKSIGNVLGDAAFSGVTREVKTERHNGSACKVGTCGGNAVYKTTVTETDEIGNIKEESFLSNNPDVNIIEALEQVSLTGGTRLITASESKNKKKIPKKSSDIELPESVKIEESGFPSAEEAPVRKHLVV